MKRVHDYKEDPADVVRSPTMGIDGQKKAGSRKRKASTPTEEPTAQRQKNMLLAPQNAQAIYYPSPGYVPQSMYDAEPIPRNQAISQWAHNQAFYQSQQARRR